ncbi:FadR/GntR family transcriptional regulator [Entomohabitans teleogrylli]|uniref:FadR/GntR family transcriptional regulator n=1 Tax=Entomohabitans teleogrylli TaxID=1384589 RepID=UPI00073D476C|nr:FadR/GntR family transcriptional regulator [Entomohabitans teleogrylli]
MIKKVTRHKASHQILDQLKEKIHDGTYPVGSKLPSENELADAFGVSRVPVREALGMLEISGIVSSRQGGGHTVENHSLLTEYSPLKMEIASADEVNALLEMREILEKEAASLAATRRSDADLQIIEQALAAFKRTAGKKQLIGHEEDYQFHRAIMLASHNPFLLQILDNMHELYLGALIYSLQHNLGNDSERQRVIQEHEQIYHAIREGDAQLAGLEMLRHLSNVKRKLKHQNARKH